MNEIEDLIKSHVHFNDVTAQGAHTMRCPMCMDDTVRAAFFFSSDSIGFHCFRGRCSFRSTRWNFSERIPMKFRNLLSALNIQLPVEFLLKKNGEYNKIEELLDESLYKIPNLEKFSFPDYFERYDAKKHTKYADYIASRGMSDADYYISTGGNTKGMLVVPFYLNGIMYGYQGRSIDKKQFKSEGRLAFYVDGGIIHKTPVIVEGVWDAKSVPFGVASLHDSINPSQAYLLRNKTPILLPDRDTTKFIDVAKKYNWRVCIPDWDCKDANEALMKYGRLGVAKMIHDGICGNVFEAEVRYKLWQTKIP